MRTPSATFVSTLILNSLFYKSEAYNGICAAGNTTRTIIVGESNITSTRSIHDESYTSAPSISANVNTTSLDDENCKGQGRFAGEIKVNSNVTYSLCANGTITGHGLLSRIPCVRLPTDVPLSNASFEYTIRPGFRCLFYPECKIYWGVSGGEGPISKEEKGSFRAYKCFATKGIGADVDWNDYYGPEPTAERCNDYEFAGQYMAMSHGYRYTSDLCVYGNYSGGKPFSGIFCTDSDALGPEVGFSIPENYRCAIYKSHGCDPRNGLRLYGTSGSRSMDIGDSPSVNQTDSWYFSYKCMRNEGDVKDWNWDSYPIDEISS
jgi:hypothetical protein